MRSQSLLRTSKWVWFVSIVNADWNMNRFRTRPNSIDVKTNLPQASSRLSICPWSDQSFKIEACQTIDRIIKMSTLPCRSHSKLRPKSFRRNDLHFQARENELRTVETLWRIIETIQNRKRTELARCGVSFETSREFIADCESSNFPQNSQLSDSREKNTPIWQGRLYLSDASIWGARRNWYRLQVPPTKLGQLYWNIAGCSFRFSCGWELVDIQIWIAGPSIFDVRWSLTMYTTYVNVVARILSRLYYLYCAINVLDLILWFLSKWQM